MKIRLKIFSLLLTVQFFSPFVSASTLIDSICPILLTASHSDLDQRLVEAYEKLLKTDVANTLTISQLEEMLRSEEYFKIPGTIDVQLVPLIEGLRALNTLRLKSPKVKDEEFFEKFKIVLKNEIEKRKESQTRHQQTVDTRAEILPPYASKISLEPNKILYRITPDGQYLIYQMTDGHSQGFIIAETSTGKILFDSLRDADFPNPTDLKEVSPDGKFILVSFSGDSRHRTAIEIPSGRKLFHHASVKRVDGFKVAPSGKFIAVAVDGGVDIVNSSTRAKEKSLVVPKVGSVFRSVPLVESISITPDNSTVLAITQLSFSQNIAEKSWIIKLGNLIFKRYPRLIVWDIQSESVVLNVGINCDYGETSRVIQMSSDKTSIYFESGGKLQLIKTDLDHHTVMPQQVISPSSNQKGYILNNRWLTLESEQGINFFDTHAKQETPVLMDSKHGLEYAYISDISQDGRYAVGTLPPTFHSEVFIWELSTGKRFQIPLPIGESKGAFFTQNSEKLFIQIGQEVFVFDVEKLLEEEY